VLLEQTGRVVLPFSFFSRRTAPRLTVSLAILVASLAWGGWVFLHTVGDPHRAERIAHAILDDAEARDELAKPLADQLVSAASLDPSQRDLVAATISDILSDPRIIGNITDAIGSVQANALGIDDPRPTVIDVGMLTSLVREHLAPISPQLAALIPPSTEKLELPHVESPAIRNLYTLAHTWTPWAALVSILAFIALIIWGDERVTLRAFGIWGISAGLFWAIGPRIGPWIAGMVAPNYNALAHATVNAVSKQLTIAATFLLVFGVLCFVLKYFFNKERQKRMPAYAAGTPEGLPWGVAPGPVAYGPAAAYYAPTTQQPVYAPGPGAAYSPTGQYPVAGYARSGAYAPTTQHPTVSPYGASPAASPPAGPAQDPTDPWAAYSQPAPPPTSAVPNLQPPPPPPRHSSTPINDNFE
jgi:hypothetical protein